MKYNTPWYFSEAGKAAFDQADKMSKKIELVYEYLLTIAPKDDSRTISYYKKTEVYPCACITAYCIGKPEYAFSKYPDFLDKEKNPFVKLFVSGHFDLRKVLSAVNDIFYPKDKNGNEKNDPYRVDLSAVKNVEYPHTFPWEKLDFPKNGEYSEKYVLERIAIWSFNWLGYTAPTKVDPYEYS